MMKKALFIGAILFSLSFTGHAQEQIEQGKILIGTSFNLSPLTQGTGIGYSSISGNGQTQTRFDLGGRGGYYIVKGWVAGADVGYNSISTGGNTLSYFAIGPFTRYTFGISDKVGVFGEANLLFASISGGATNSSGIDFGLGLGPTLFIKDNLTLDLAIKVISTRDRSGSTNTVYTGTGLSIGFNIVF